ncbi:MAG: hypothetical protein ABIQ01_01915, partial [Pseudolysinimonas sp.]
MPQPWSDDAIRHLLDATTCPRCGVDALQERRCLNCGADLRSEIADELWIASNAAAGALRTRQQVLDRVPVEKVLVPDAVAAPAAAAAVASAAPSTVGAPAALPERSSATVQSVLAVAGAGLFAVAAIVFTFFNADLTDHVLRSIIVGAVTLVFLGGAWALARRKLQFSAEAVGALGMVFVALDVYAVSELAHPPVSPWVFAAVGTLVSAVVMIAVAAVARIRSWLLLALLGLAIVPAMFGYAGETAWSAVLGHLGVGFAVLVLHEGVRRLAPRFDGKLTADRVTLSVLQVVAVAVALIQLPSTESASVASHWLSIAGVLAAVAVLAVFATRHLIAPFWSFVVGAFAVAAVVVLPFALELDRPEWYLALVPAAASLAVMAIAAVPKTATVLRPLLTTGVFAVGAIASVATVLAAGIAVLLTMVSSSAFSNYETVDVISTDGGVAIPLGLVAAAIGLAVFAVLTSRRAGSFTGPARVAAAFAVSLLMLAAGAFASWTAFLPVTRIAIAVGVALLTALVLLFVPAVRRAPSAVRIPAIVGAHLALFFGAVISWSDSSLTIWAGVAVVAVLCVVALTVPAVIRPAHVGIGYAYALVIFARWLDLADLEALPTIAVLCLTTTLASVGAIVATLVDRIRAASWYSVLIVTAVPFLIGIAVTFFERSGWTALSTGVTFVLALTLLLTRRPGLNYVLRAIAAGLLVPALAVVAVSLGAQFLESSGSPIVLPVIAVLVAGVLPSTGLIRSGLLHRGLPERDAGLARLWIEGSALLTGAIAVVLGLVLPAAGFDTTFLVLLILGVGAGAAAIWAKRRYGWWVAFACFTGALWCQWALAHVTAIEPYLLPPAFALAIIGAIVTGRGGRGAGLYATGLAVATVPVLGILAAAGNDDDATVGSIPWRAAGLLVGAGILLVLGALMGRGDSRLAVRFRALRIPTLAVAIAAGAAGPLQGLRYGLDKDPLALAPWPLLLVCLAYGAAGAIVAGAAARVILDSAAPGSRLAHTRWLYVPATVYVALSGWTAMHRDWSSIWTMWGLMLAYLLFMVVIVVRARRHATTLPPVWLVFAVAFITAIVGWSARDLRVEWFSMPLGLLLLAAGILAMRGVADDARPAVATANSWPIGHRGSWSLLGPGIATTFLASTLATGTDPQTWRAIMVIALALVAILLGSQLKLAAPFFLGIIVLPIENIVVFAVQIGRGIESVPWWITLAIVGAV